MNDLKPILWCVHVLGPDDVYAFSDRDSAASWAMDLNKWAWSRPEHPYNPHINAVVTEWPWSAESHAENLARGDARYR